MKTNLIILCSFLSINLLAQSVSDSEKLVDQSIANQSSIIESLQSIQKRIDSLDAESKKLTNEYKDTIVEYEILKNYDDHFETAMLYMSDHGESLGENSLYLHGLPNFMAPDEQRKIPAIIWLGEKYEASNANMLAKINVPLSHDYFFHTVLGLLELQTDIYDFRFDIVHGAI